MDSPLNGGDDFITRQTSNMNDAFAKWATPRRIEAIRESCAMTVVTHGAMGNFTFYTHTHMKRTSP